MTGWIWFLVPIGIVVVGVGMFYGQQQSSLFKRDRNAVKRQEKVTRQIYRNEETRPEVDV